MGNGLIWNKMIRPGEQTSLLFPRGHFVCSVGNADEVLWRICDENGNWSVSGNRVTLQFTDRCRVVPSYVRCSLVGSRPSSRRQTRVSGMRYVVRMRYWRRQGGGNQSSRRDRQGRRKNWNTNTAVATPTAFFTFSNNRSRFPLCAIREFLELRGRLLCLQVVLFGFFCFRLDINIRGERFMFVSYSIQSCYHSR